MANELQLNGMTAQEAYTQVVDKGVAPSDAAILVSGWIFENFGKTKRVFNFKQAFPEQEPDCVSQFERSFEHQDWTDGESVVQAEATAGEEGFNTRFHNIESDLDALGNDVVKAFSCMAEMRADLFAMLHEIRIELNRINADIHECCNTSTPRPSGPGGLAVPFEGLKVNPMFMGATKFMEKDVTLWQTADGLFMLPAAKTVNVEVVEDPRIKMAGYVARYVEENPQVQELLQGGATKQDLVNQFGNDFVKEGLTFREALEILPDRTSFESPDDLTNMLAERQAAIMRTTRGASQAIAAAFDLQTDLDQVANAPLDNFNAIPSKVRAGLITAGITTVGDLTKADTRQLQSTLQQQGVQVTAGELAQWTGMANTLTQIR